MSAASGSSTWAVVLRRELRDLWIGGKALILVLLHTVLLGAYSFLLASNAEINLLPRVEMISEIVKASITVGLFICLIIGAVTNNLSMMHRLIYAELRQTEMPFYIAFFVLSGASLHLDALAHVGMLGMAYLFARPVGKYLGSVFASRRYGGDAQLGSNLGMALLPQAGVAIGMSLIVSEQNPDFGRIVSTVILSSVIVYESVGPFLAKFALARAGELHPED